MRRLVTAACLCLLAACATATGGLEPEVQSSEPIAAASARITVRGLACPQCASNVDLQLLRVPGVARVRIDMGQGHVDVDFQPDLHPSARALATAVRDSGFTVVAVEERRK